MSSKGSLPRPQRRERTIILRSRRDPFSSEGGSKHG